MCSGLDTQQSHWQLEVAYEDASLPLSVVHCPQQYLNSPGLILGSFFLCPPCSSLPSGSPRSPLFSFSQKQKLLRAIFTAVSFIQLTICYPCLQGPTEYPKCCQCHFQEKINERFLTKLNFDYINCQENESCPVIINGYPTINNIQPSLC